MIAAINCISAPTLGGESVSCREARSLAVKFSLYSSVGPGKIIVDDFEQPTG